LRLLHLAFDVWPMCARQSVPRASLVGDKRMERAWDLDEQHTVAPAGEPQRDLLAGAELEDVPVGGV